MDTTEREAENKAFNELIDKYCTFEDGVLNDRDEMHVDYAVNAIADAIYDGIEKGKEIANDLKKDQASGVRVNALVSRMDFSDWIHDVTVIDPKQKHLKKDTPVYEFEDWITWYAMGLTPTEAVSQNYKEYG